jgi:hypothetical protein
MHALYANYLRKLEIQAMHEVRHTYESAGIYFIHENKVKIVTVNRQQCHQYQQTNYYVISPQTIKHKKGNNM